MGSQPPPWLEAVRGWHGPPCRRHRHKLAAHGLGPLEYDNRRDARDKVLVEGPFTSLDSKGTAYRHGREVVVKGGMS